MVLQPSNPRLLTNLEDLPNLHQQKMVSSCEKNNCDNDANSEGSLKCQIQLYWIFFCFLQEVHNILNNMVQHYMFLLVLDENEISFKLDIEHVMASRIDSKNVMFRESLVRKFIQENFFDKLAGIQHQLYENLSEFLGFEITTLGCANMKNYCTLKKTDGIEILFVQTPIPGTLTQSVENFSWQKDHKHSDALGLIGACTCHVIFHYLDLESMLAGREYTIQEAREIDGKQVPAGNYFNLEHIVHCMQPHTDQFVLDAMNYWRSAMKTPMLSYDISYWEPDQLELAVQYMKRNELGVLVPCVYELEDERMEEDTSHETEE